MLKKIYKYGNKIKNHSKSSKEYIEKRYTKLIQKGYSPEQAQNMIYFELGVSAVMRESIETATAEECMMVGRLVGTEVGATIGGLSANIAGVGTGSFIGGITGTFLGKTTCNKIIKFASEKTIQKVSEELVKQAKDGSIADIDVEYINTYVKDKNKKSYNFNPSNAIKNNMGSNTTVLKATVTKNVFNKPSHNSKSKVDFDESKDYSGYINEVTNSNKIYTKEDLESMTETELQQNKSAIDYQRQTIGIPTNKQAKASGMVFVNGYTRSDGVQVKSYYRTRPD